MPFISALPRGSFARGPVALQSIRPSSTVAMSTLDNGDSIPVDEVIVVVVERGDVCIGEPTRATPVAAAFPPEPEGEDEDEEEDEAEDGGDDDSDELASR